MRQKPQYILNGESHFCYDIRDHQGNIRQVREANGSKGEVIQSMNYYPFGAEFCDNGTKNYTQKHKYNGKEFDNMHGLNSYDYGARQYNPVTLRWDRIDPLAEKYYSTSPYVYCLNNPVMLIDPDGRDIIPTLVTGWKGDNAIKKDFVSTKGFVRAMNLIGQTSYGKHIVSSFLPKGKMQYGVSGQGQYSEYILQFTEANCASASDQEDVLGRYVGSSEVYGTFGFDEFGNGDNKGLQYEITIDVKRDFADMLVTMVHEIALHGSAIDAINQAYQEGGIDKAKELWKKLAADDHKNLKNHNSATNDYKTYESMMKELIKLDPSLESAFKRADQRAQKQY